MAGGWWAGGLGWLGWLVGLNGWDGWAGLLVGRLLLGYLTCTTFTSPLAVLFVFGKNLLLELYPIWLGSCLSLERPNPYICFGIFAPLSCFLTTKRVLLEIPAESETVPGVYGRVDRTLHGAFVSLSNEDTFDPLLSELSLSSQVQNG